MPFAMLDAGAIIASYGASVRLLNSRITQASGQ